MLALQSFTLLAKREKAQDAGGKPPIPRKVIAFAKVEVSERRPRYRAFNGEDLPNPTSRRRKPSKAPLGDPPLWLQCCRAFRQSLLELNDPKPLNPT